ncbi:hypothetical protein ERO13_D09G086250v2, partial [Gossypium hirsutum]
NVEKVHYLNSLSSETLNHYVLNYSTRNSFLICLTLCCLCLLPHLFSVSITHLHQCFAFYSHSFRLLTLSFCFFSSLSFFFYKDVKHLTPLRFEFLLIVDSQIRRKC